MEAILNLTKNINFDWSIFVPIFLAFLGWVIVNRQNIARDRQNKLRDIRTQYLINTFKNLSDASMRPPKPDSEYFRNIESAISDIQLLGTEDQVAQANSMIEEYSKSGIISLDPMLNDLRTQLRKELQLSQLRGNVRWLRMEGAPELPKTQSEN